jgi:hypothetical protein
MTVTAGTLGHRSYRLTRLRVHVWSHISKDAFDIALIGFVMLLRHGRLGSIHLHPAKRLSAPTPILHETKFDAAEEIRGTSDPAMSSLPPKPVNMQSPSLLPLLPPCWFRPLITFPPSQRYIKAG